MTENQEMSEEELSESIDMQMFNIVSDLTQIAIDKGMMLGEQYYFSYVDEQEEGPDMIFDSTISITGNDRRYSARIVRKDPQEQDFSLFTMKAVIKPTTSDEEPGFINMQSSCVRIPAEYFMLYVNDPEAITAYLDDLEEVPDAISNFAYTIYGDQYYITDRLGVNAVTEIGEDVADPIKRLEILNEIHDMLGQVRTR